MWHMCWKSVNLHANSSLKKILFSLSYRKILFIAFCKFLRSVSDPDFFSMPSIFILYLSFINAKGFRAQINHSGRRWWHNINARPYQELFYSIRALGCQLTFFASKIWLEIICFDCFWNVTKSLHSHVGIKLWSQRHLHVEADNLRSYLQRRSVNWPPHGIDERRKMSERSNDMTVLLETVRITLMSSMNLPAAA